MDEAAAGGMMIDRETGDTSGRGIAGMATDPDDPLVPGEMIEVLGIGKAGGVLHRLVDLLHLVVEALLLADDHRLPAGVTDLHEGGKSRPLAPRSGKLGMIPLQRVGLVLPRTLLLVEDVVALHVRLHLAIPEVDLAHLP